MRAEADVDVAEFQAGHRDVIRHVEDREQSLLAGGRERREVTQLRLAARGIKIKAALLAFGEGVADGGVRVAAIISQQDVLLTRIQSDDFASGEGSVERIEVIDTYVQDIAGRFTLAEDTL